MCVHFASLAPPTLMQDTIYHSAFSMPLLTPDDVPVEFLSLERIPTHVFDTSVSCFRHVAEVVRDTIHTKSGSMTVLGLDTDPTWRGVYDELIRLHQEEGLSFRNVVTFNVADYHGLLPDAAQSTWKYMQEHLFDHIDLPKQNIHIPDFGLDCQGSSIEECCKHYEAKIAQYGGIDVFLVGQKLGFNESGCKRESTTRLVYIDRMRRQSLASDFNGIDYVPEQAITMGIRNILDARKVIVMALGEGSSTKVARCIEGPVDATVPATFLQTRDPDETRFILDQPAAELLTRYDSPWLALGDGTHLMEWDDFKERKAVVWLSLKLKKAILKLVELDYLGHC